MAPSTEPRTPPRRWILCGLLFLATTLNYLDRQTVSILAPTIQREMHLDNEALGWLFSLFYYSYTLAQFAIGVLLDRANLRWAYGLAVLAWSLVAGLTGTAATFAGLAAFRLALGITESANWPAAMRVVARALPPRDRPLGNGIFTSGTSIGALIAPGLILGVSAWIGWRWAFAAVASLGALWFVAWVAFTAHPSLRGIWRDTEAPASSPAGGYRAVLSSAAFWRVFAVTILVNPCLYFNLNWLPTYFVQQRGIDAGAQLGAILTAIYVGLDAGYLLCGFGTKALSKRLGVTAARRAVFSAATVLLAISAAAPGMPDASSAAAVLVIANVGVGAWIAMYLTMAQEVSSEHVSTAAGLLGGSGSLAGALAMWAVGRATKVTGSFALPFAAIAVAAALAWTAGMAVTRARRGADHGVS